LGLIPPIVWQAGTLRGDYVGHGGIIDADFPLYPCAIMMLAADGAGTAVTDIFFIITALLNAVIYAVLSALMFATFCLLKRFVKIFR
jgi:hypothetical protein